MLPIKKVVLFKHGVGHFEREGQVNGDASIDLHFRVSEMNDVLKSLTALDLDNGVITSISYESTLPVEEQLKDIAIQLPEKNALKGLLSQLQGAHVALEIGQKTVTGVVTGIETIKRQTNISAFDSTYLSLLVDGKTLQSFDVMEAKQITLLDDNLKKDLQHLLDVLIAAKKKDLKKLTLFLKGEGERTINMSYVVAAPVWKTSYRLLLEEKKAFIQGWALVDNTQDEDWENVSLSLVAGLPVSFIHDLYSPRYQQRPEVKVKQEAAYAPPISEKAVVAGAALDDDLSLDDDDDLSLDDLGSEAGKGERVTAIEAMAMMERRVALKKPSMPVQTRTVEVGDLFHYDIENPVTVRRQQSALVPILQTQFNGKRIAVYNQEVRKKNPMSAILFENTTGLTLENGPVTVFEEDDYVGETMLNTLKPDEEQIVSYSVELGCIVSIEARSDSQNVHQVRITDGNVRFYHYEFIYKTYVINNKTDRTLDFFLEHRFFEDWDLVDTPEPLEKTENFYRFRFNVPSKKTKPFTVTERFQRSKTNFLRNTSRDELSLWLDLKYLDKKTARALEGIIELTENMTQMEREIETKQEAIEAVFKNQERIRKNLQALGNTEDERVLRERYITNLEQEEDKLSKYQADIETLKANKNTTEQTLNTQLKSIEFKAML
jgi:hypothetical protein